MKCIVIIFLVAHCCLAQAPVSSPTIKGHTLGETIIQFIQNSGDSTKAEFLACARATGPKKVKVSVECRDFQTATEVGMTGRIVCNDSNYEMGLCRDFEGYARFESNKLVELNVEFRNSRWGDALDDATSKFGKPDLVGVDTAQNAYGAKWDLQTALWSKPEYIVTVYEKINTRYNLQRFIEVALTDRKFWDVHNPKKTKNSLD